MGELLAPPQIGAQQAAEAGRVSADVVVSRARWAGALLALLQAVLYVASPGIVPPYSSWWALLPAGILLGVDLVTRLVARTGAVPSTWRLVGLIGDSVAVLLFIAVFSFDPMSALWTLMMLPVAEAAMRGWHRGAIIVFVVLAVGYVGTAWAAEARWSTAALSIDSLTYRLGLVGIMALILAGMSRRLEQQIASTAARQAEADQLRAVATAARLMSELDVATVIREVRRAAERMGFHDVQVWTRAGVLGSSGDRGGTAEALDGAAGEGR